MKTNSVNKQFVEVDVTEAKDNRIVRRNSWWLCVDGDETRALLFKSVGGHLSPQCNSSEKISISTCNHKMYTAMNAKPVFIDLAFVPERL